MITDDKLDTYFDKWWKDDMNDFDKMDKRIDGIFKFTAGFMVIYVIGFFIFWGAVIFAILKLANKYG